jgi:uncharacterized membrane protein YhiD involved in acid resistance
VTDLFPAFVPATLQPPLAVLARLLAAWLLGCVVALIYRRSRPAGAVLASFPGTLVLLAVLIAMVTQVIGDNVARAFSLVGALSIVRFRTVVRDTQDTAYVIFAVAVGMAVGAAHLWIALAGIGVVAVAAFVLREPEGAAEEAGTPYALTVRSALGIDQAAAVRPVIEQYFQRLSTTGASTSRQGLAIEVSYAGLLIDDRDAQTVVAALNRLEGVQDVRVERLDARPE